MVESIRNRTCKAGVGLAFAGLLAAMVGLAAPATAAEFEVQKSEGCMCCDGWAEHLRARGHLVNMAISEDIVRLKASLGIPEALWSCHTARVGGYIVEGHVPVEDIERLLVEQPDALGLAAPGMPMGSPGMDFGTASEPYDVILFRADGTSEVFAHHQ